MVVASKPYQPGDQITVAKPFIYSLILKYKAQRCDACFKPPAADAKLKNCSRCSQAWYCSKKCQKQDWFFHKYECPVFTKHPITQVDNSDEDFFGLFLRAVLFFKAKPSASSAKYRLLNGRELAFEDLKHEILHLTRCGGATIFVKYERRCRELFGVSCDQLEVILFCQLSINSHTVGVPSRDRPDLLDHVADAIWLEASLFQHSCIPSMFLKYDGSKMVMMAAKKIKVGEELTFAYPYIRICRETAFRRRLSIFFNFLCECQRCQVPFEFDLDDNFINYNQVDQFRVVSLGMQSFPILRLALGSDSNALFIIGQIYPYHHLERTALLVKLVKANAQLSLDSFAKLSIQERDIFFPDVDDSDEPLVGFDSQVVVRLAIEALKVTHPNEEVAKFDVGKSDVKEMKDYLVKYDKIK